MSTDLDPGLENAETSLTRFLLLDIAISDAARDLSVYNSPQRCGMQDEDETSGCGKCCPADSGIDFDEWAGKFCLGYDWLEP